MCPLSRQKWFTQFFIQLAVLGGEAATLARSDRSFSSGAGFVFGCVERVAVFGCGFLFTGSGCAEFRWVVRHESLNLMCR